MVGSAARSLRNCLSVSGVMPGNAAITSGGAVSTSTPDTPLKMVTNRSARSTSAGGRPSTKPSSLTWANGAWRGE